MNTWLRREKHQGLSCIAFWQSFNKYFINMQMYVKYLVTSVMQSSNPSNRTVDQSSFHNVPPPHTHTHILFKKEDDHISLLYWIIVNTHVQLYPPPPPPIQFTLQTYSEWPTDCPSHQTWRTVQQWPEMLAMNSWSPSTCYKWSLY